MLNISGMKEWARSIKRDVIVVWLAARDPRVPWYIKALAAFIAAYALSPIDLIPDFIPVLGYFDDLIIVPLGILLVTRLIPETLLIELREEATHRANKPKSYSGAAIIILLWIALGFAMLCWLLKAN